MKNNIIIQVRMSSTRLPGKIMKLLANKEVLWHVIERCKKSKADKVIVATSTHKSDDEVVLKCEEWSVPCVRGDLNNVLSRYMIASNKFPSDIIVRVTGDCPLIDPRIINLVIDNIKNGVDYASNVINRDFPRGLDVEAFTKDALKKAINLAKTDREKEHVTLIMRENKSGQFKVKDVAMPKEYQFPQFRLTLDTAEDYQLIKKIYDEFYTRGSIINLPNVIKWLMAHPRIALTNTHIKQKNT